MIRSAVGSEGVFPATRSVSIYGMLAILTVAAADLVGAQAPSAGRQRTAILRESIRGRVTTDSAVAIPGATVTVTRAPDRAFKSTTTDTSGRFEVIFAEGTGDYLVHIEAPGRKVFRKRVTRVGNDSVFVVDAQLASPAQQLAPVQVQARKPRPSRERSFGTEPGAAEKLADGVNGAVPPGLAGNVAALGAIVPGVSLTPDGISVLGLQSVQNGTILNGMSFAGASVPRDARTNVRFSTSTFDPARGWFSGAQQDVELASGDLFSFRRSHFTLDLPVLQYTDEVSSRLGQEFTNLQTSVGGDGTLEGDRFVYSFGADAGRQSAGLTSLIGADQGLLQSAGVSADSIARFLQLLFSKGIPATVPGKSASRTHEHASFIGRLDHAPYDWKTFTPARTTVGVLGYGKIARAQSPGLFPTGTPAHGGSTVDGGGSIQVIYSSFKGKEYSALTTARSSFTLSRSQRRPYVELPDGRVLVSSAFPDATSGAATLGFGGNGSQDGDDRRWTWETNGDVRFYLPRHPSHLVKLTADSRFDGFALEPRTNQLGTFWFNSLADMSANSPSRYTRNLGVPARDGGEWNGFIALGDRWRKSDRLQVLYGVRLEGNHFLRQPRVNPAVESAFGVGTANAPNTIHLSPRLGFTWIRSSRTTASQTQSGLGKFYIAPPGYLRGGIGEFRNMLSPTLLSHASVSTGLPTGVRQIACIGPSVPQPEWERYASDPTSIPDRCLASESANPFSDTAPGVLLFDPRYTAARSWRGNLAYSSSYRAFIYTVEGLYSLNLNQPGSVDLNFRNVPRFSLGEEERPVFVSPSSIISSTGAVSALEARSFDSFGSVTSARSDLQSRSRQLTFTASPNRSLRWYFSAAYTLSSVRALASGFDAPTFSTPSKRTWARADLDARHQMLAQGGYVVKGFNVTFFGRLQSGWPFTPIVSGDVNGDGIPNDRAFIFDPARASDPAVGAGVSSLLESSSGRVSECIRRQLGRAAARNSCEGPWTSSLNAQISRGQRVKPLNRWVDVAMAFTNPLGGLDQLLHSSGKVHGWGSPQRPDPVLYHVRGFDEARRRFIYEVNPQFGSTRSTNAGFRVPFRVTLDISVDIGTPIPRQQLTRWLNPGRNGRPGPRLPATELKQRYERNVPDPYRQILEETDSLLLTREQVEAVQTIQVAYRQKMDSLWMSLAEDLAGLGDRFDAGRALRRQEAAVDDGWELTRLDVQRTIPGVLSPLQIALLPWQAKLFYQSRQRIKARMFMSGD